MKIEGVSATGIETLPPLKSARPNISFKEMEVQHLTETIYYPQKPEWKPVNLVLYDLKKSRHPVMEWLKKSFDPKTATWKPSGDNDFKQKIILEVYDGCGNTMEKWVFDNAWPQSVEFGELDMGNSEILTAEITLRYDRAYIEN